METSGRVQSLAVVATHYRTTAPVSKSGTVL